MRFIVAALAMLLHLSQICPALSCTFKQLPPSAMITVPHYHADSPFIKQDIKDCMQMCFENTSCAYVLSFENGKCSSDASEGNTFRVDSMMDEFGHSGVAFQLYRNATATECPTLEEWSQQSRTWCGASFNCAVLALNRVVEMIPPASFLRFLFEGKALGIWMRLSVLYMVALPFITRTHPYNSLISTYIPSPMITDDEINVLLTCPHELNVVRLLVYPHISRPPRIWRRMVMKFKMGQAKGKQTSSGHIPIDLVNHCTAIERFFQRIHTIAVAFGRIDGTPAILKKKGIKQ
ncbi:hypothetical protein OSTOST_02067, partial [Ostertagia ostertagi]